jgi:hypothetical protein
VSKLRYVAVLLVLFVLRDNSSAQLANYAVSNVVLNVGLSGLVATPPNASPLQYCFYALKLTVSPSSDPNTLIVSGESGFGKRYDVAPDAITPVATPVEVEPNSVIRGPVLTNTSESTFLKKIGRTWIMLTNQTVSEAAFINIVLSDGGLIKGPFVYSYNRSQQVFRGQLVWKTNDTWFGGQVFATYNGMSGSQMLGE